MKQGMIPSERFVGVYWRVPHLLVSIHDKGCVKEGGSTGDSNTLGVDGSPGEGTRQHQMES